MPKSMKTSASKLAVANALPVPETTRDGWPEIDLDWLAPATAAGPAFPIDALPPLLGAMIEQFSTERRVSIDFVAGALLGAASATIGNRARLLTYDGRAEPLSLFLALVGWPGCGKSTALSIVEQPLTRIEDALVEAHLAQFNNGKGRLSALAASLGAPVARRLAFEGIEPMQAGAAVEEAPPPALLLSEWTAAGLLEELRHDADGRAILVDELSGAFAGSSGQAGLKTRALILQGFDGKAYRKRTATGGRIYVPALQITVLGTTQPDRVAALVGRARDGLVPRFLWIAPEVEPSADLPRGSGPVEALEAALSRLVGIPPAGSADQYSHLVPLGADARAPLEESSQIWVASQKRADVSSQDVIARARQQTMRIATVLALAEHALAGKDGTVKAVEAVDVERGIKLLNGYFLPMAERTFALAGAPREGSALRLARYLRRLAKPVVSLRDDLYRGAGSPVRAPADVADAIEELRQREFVRDAPRRSGPGRPSLSVEVHPGLLAK